MSNMKNADNDLTTTAATVATPTTPSMSDFDKKVSLRSLKQAEVGDMVVITKTNGYLGLYSVQERVPTRGRHGNVAIKLGNYVTGRVWSFKVSTELPDSRISLIRRVSKGINSSRGALTETPMNIAAPEEFGPASDGGSSFVEAP